MKYLIKLLTVMALAAFSVNASAVSIGTTGTRDDLIAQTTLGSSGASTEESWIESVLGMDISYTQFSDTTSGGESGNWEAVTGGIDGDYAFDFGSLSEPTYFLLKVATGGGAGADNTHYLYKNLESLQWAYINLADFGTGVELTNIGIISHVGTVPAPGPLAIMAIGLVGIGVRQVKKAS